VKVYVEAPVAMAYDRGCAAWTFDPAHWGVCGQGLDESDALADLGTRVGTALEVVERVTGDEQAFARDRALCTTAERSATLAVLAEVRPRTAQLVETSSAVLLDWDDPQRTLPGFARWRTLRQLAWHIADTESRYYLTALGLAARPRADDLRVELAESYRHVCDAIASLPADLVVESGGEVWTTTKVLRRLAWHERGELVVMERLASRGRATLGWSA